jgi:hypothetical protein
VSIDLRGGTTDRIVTIVTIADMRAAEPGTTLSTGPSRDFVPILADYARRAADGRLGVRIDRNLPLADADAAEAQELSEAGHSLGKLVLRCTSVTLPHPQLALVPASVSGPRELLSTTWYPASMASRAMVLPMYPLPMNPTVVIFSASFQKGRTLVICRTPWDSGPCRQLAEK